MKVKILKNVMIHGGRVTAGAEVEMSEAEAKNMVAGGFISADVFQSAAKTDSLPEATPAAEPAKTPSKLTKKKK